MKYIQDVTTQGPSLMKPVIIYLIKGQLISRSFMLRRWSSALMIR